MKKDLTELYKIPIYRMLLSPESFLIENNTNEALINLITQIPNYGNVNHVQILKLKNADFRRVYYNSQLLIETKVFCKQLLVETELINEGYKEIILGKDLNQLFSIIESNRIVFFKRIVINNLIEFKLDKGKLIEQIKNCNEIGEIIALLKSYLVLKKLVSELLRGIKYFN
jgi:hypothetical protein